ncbi:dual specificity phosphatase-like protein [Leishmania infantum JPCM5]|uniref:protein-tyrosine-phosphatase n=2 Tax=Leishmania infantum TaxID=5671 RepID=A0A6L0WHN8_LEIIN|nr:dual specificity phosphatase-like protein [Leishmania infantum JPCM5]CAC9442928.1 dual_specificity_phosphatase-like_protein [Leishmania infantum]CAM65341.2 dual specificity phosphatase-like protein [Leishmania infantum JPCM5]SUZ38942.1 dual_specificity_phosphatase-like_protein [Leishmania infantum]|eukprot:XP_001462995.2 dual specificity phosphatase-like protein [Leishmania infantum JPCM5]
MAPSSTAIPETAAAPGAPRSVGVPASPSRGSRMSKCKRCLQNLNGPAFDLKAVQEAQHTFLEEESVCNAAQVYPMSDITSLLAVGSWKDASNPELLKAHNIRYVLNVAKELIPTEEAKMIAQNNDIVSEWIPMSDSHTQDVSEHLIKAFRFIERARSEHSRVLVHCRRGISRSAAIIVAYLMASEHRSYEDALKFVTERRSCVSLNLAFQERLSEFVPSSEFFHGPPTQQQQQQQQQPGAASPLSASSSNSLLPTLAGVAPRTDSAHANHSSQPQPLQGSDHPLLLPPECRSVTSSTGSSHGSSRASSGVRVAPSQSLGLQKADKQASVLCSATSTAAPASTRATSGKSGKSTSLEKAFRSHALPKQQQSRRGSAAPQALALTGTTTRLSARSVAAAVTPGIQSAEDEVTATPAPESVGSRDDGDDEIEEPCSPMGIHGRRALARLSCAQASSSSASAGPRKHLPRTYSAEEELLTTTMAMTATVTTTLMHANKCGPDGMPAAANEEVGDGEVRCSSSSANTSESHLHLHHSPRAPAQRGSAFDVSDDEADDNGSIAGTGTPLSLQKKSQRNPRVRKALSANSTGAPASENEGNSSEGRQDLAAGERNRSPTATGGGDMTGTAVAMDGLPSTRYGTQSAFNEEGVAPQSPTAVHPSSVVAGATSRASSLSG